MMICPECKGEMKEERTSVTLFREGQPVLFEDVPAWVCAVRRNLAFGRGSEKTGRAIGWRTEASPLYLNARGRLCRHQLSAYLCP